jgi:hypothetical protein
MIYILNYFISFDKLVLGRWGGGRGCTKNWTNLVCFISVNKVNYNLFFIGKMTSETEYAMIAYLEIDDDIDMYFTLGSLNLSIP